MLKYPSKFFIGAFAFLLILASSCSTPKNTTLFQTIPYNSELQTLITKDFEHKIKPDDILLIDIISPSEEAKNYNTTPDGYVVDKNGNLQLYRFGDIKVLDLTLSQLKAKITKLLVPDIFKQVSVTARFKNHKVLVMGKVGQARVIPMETEHLSLLEALSLSGDLNDDARKDNILVIRNTEKGKLFYRVNLLDGSIFNSNFYYLQADDIVYVEEDREKKDKGNTQQIITYVVSGMSFLFLIFDRINR